MQSASHDKRFLCKTEETDMFFNPGKETEVQVPETITGEWLLSRLKDELSFSGAPLENIVVTRELRHHHSRIVFFQAIYASDYIHGYPVRWMAKIRTDNEGLAEGAFYQLARKKGMTVALTEFGGLIPLGESSSMLLLKNMQHDYRLLVSSEQVFTSEYWQPTPKAIEGVLAKLARFHARWWDNKLLRNNPDIFSKGAWWGRDEQFVENESERRHQAKAFLQAHKDEPDVDVFINESLENLSNIRKRLNRESVTCVHGDCYPWHFFVSRLDQTVKLFDLEFVGYNTPAHDLVSLLAYWRGDLDQVMKQYCQSLKKYGVENYGLSQLKDDMRLAIYGHALITIQDWQRGCSPALWNNKFKGLLRLKSMLHSYQV